MTYKVFGGMLSLTQSINQSLFLVDHRSTVLWCCFRNMLAL